MNENEPLVPSRTEIPLLTWAKRSDIWSRIGVAALIASAAVDVIVQTKGLGSGLNSWAADHASLARLASIVAIPTDTSVLLVAAAVAAWTAMLRSTRKTLLAFTATMILSILALTAAVNDVASLIDAQVIRYPLLEIALPSVAYACLYLLVRTARMPSRLRIVLSAACVAAILIACVNTVVTYGSYALADIVASVLFAAALFCFGVSLAKSTGIDPFARGVDA
ncbi:MAG TPA: hypothetical protein VIN40_05660 [Candidatus Tyrphobacter sp.]